MEEKIKNTGKVILKNGLTINLGQYESAKIEAGIEIQGDKENLEELWKQADEEVKQHLEEQVAELTKEFDRRKTILGFKKDLKF